MILREKTKANNRTRGENSEEMVHAISVKRSREASRKQSLHCWKETWKTHSKDKENQGELSTNR